MKVTAQVLSLCVCHLKDFQVMLLLMSILYLNMNYKPRSKLQMQNCTDLENLQESGILTHETSVWHVKWHASVMRLEWVSMPMNIHLQHHREDIPLRVSGQMNSLKSKHWSASLQLRICFAVLQWCSLSAFYTLQQECYCCICLKKMHC